MTAEELRAARAAHWRQDGHPLLTLEEAMLWLEGHPLCLFLPRHRELPAPAPSFVEACAGAAAPAQANAAVELAHSFAARLMASGAIVGLNLTGAVGEQPDFLATREILPYIFAVRGDRDWRRAPEKLNGRSPSPLVRDLWSIVQREGGLSLAAARSALGREVTEAAALRGMNELWQSFRLSPVLQVSGEPALWEPLTLHFAAELALGGSSSQVTAISILASTYLQSVYAATGEEVEVFLSPIASRSRTREAVRGLSATGQIHSLTLESHTYLFQDLSLFSPKEDGSEKRLKAPLEAPSPAAEAIGPPPEARPPAAPPQRAGGAGSQAPGFGGRERPRQNAAAANRDPRPAPRPTPSPDRSARGDSTRFAAKPTRQSGGKTDREIPAGRRGFQSPGRGAQDPRAPFRPVPGPAEGARSGGAADRTLRKPAQNAGARRSASDKSSYGPPMRAGRFGAGAGRPRRSEEPAPGPASGRRYGSDSSPNRPSSEPASRRGPDKWKGRRPGGDPGRGAPSRSRSPFSRWAKNPSTGASTSPGARDGKGPQGSSRNVRGKYGKQASQSSPGGGSPKRGAFAGPERLPGDRRPSFRRGSPARGMTKGPRRAHPGDRDPDRRLGRNPKDSGRRPYPNRGESARQSSAVKGDRSGDAGRNKPRPSPGAKHFRDRKLRKHRPAAPGWNKQRGGARRDDRPDQRRPEAT